MPSWENSWFGGILGQGWEGCPAEISLRFDRAGGKGRRLGLTGT
jgi:hypothetical protein